VVFGGDMAYRGFIEAKGGFQFQTWKTLFEPLTSKDIKLYTAIGNHELYREHSALGFFLENQKEFQEIFSEKPGIPGNPVNGPDDYKGLVYSFTSPEGDAFFATLDPYYLKANYIPSDLGGSIDQTQLDWLKARVAETKATHKFLFIHTPYYYISADSSESSTVNESFKELWTILDDNRFDLYACGHSHLYSRKTIDSSVLPEPPPPLPLWQHNVVQLLNGTCGAPTGPVTIPDAKRALWHVFAAADTYYFSVIDISGREVRVNSYKGNTGEYTLFDSFQLPPTVYMPLILK
jgi:hypothetical protein